MDALRQSTPSSPTAVRLADEPHEEERAPRNGSAVWKGAQPFPLLVTTALLSGYLMPAIDRSRQDHQKALEVKTEYIDGISEAVARIMLAVQFAESSYGGQTQEQFDEAYRAWETETLKLSGRLRAHFADGKIHEEWSAFSGMVTEVYALSGTTQPAHRKDRLEKLRRYLGEDAAQWDVLLDIESRSQGFDGFQTYYGAWFSLREAVYSRLEEFLQELLASEMRRVS